MFNNKLIKKFLSAAAAGTLLFGTVNAIEISYDGGVSDFNVSGCTDFKKAGQIVTLKVEDNLDNLLLMRQTETNANGEWNILFGLDYEGIITVNVSEDGVLVPEQTIYRSTADEVTDALSAVNTGSVNDAIRTFASVLQIDYEEYAGVATSGLLDSFIESQRSYTSIGAVKKAYNQGKFLAMVQKPASAADVILQIEKSYPEISEAAKTEVSGIYDSYDDSEKLDIISKLKGTAFENMAAYAKARDEAIVINEMNKAGTYNEKYSIVDTYNSILGLDLSKYAALGKNFQSFKQKLFALSNTDAETLKSNAETVYERLKNDSVGGTPSSSGGGGGKGPTIRIDEDFVGQAEIKPIPQFNDMEDYEWAKTAVYTLAARQVINGKADGVFAPADTVTRAEFVKMLAGAFAISSDSDIKFKDVPKGHWAYEFVSSAVGKGIVRGKSEIDFGADDKITRQDMAAICGRLMDSLKVEAIGAEVLFADEQEISEYAKAFVGKLAKAGIVNGVGENKFAPQNNATRAEAAVMIYNLLEYCKGGE